MSDSKGYKNICDEYPIKVIFNGYDSYWKGQNEYAVYVKKNHSKFSFGYEKYWLVYGKVKYIHLFMDPCSPYAYFMDELNDVKNEYPNIIKEVRGIGLLIGLQLHEDQNKFIKKLEDNKLLTMRAGENVVRILPPLNVKKNEIDIAIKIIRKVCNEMDSI